MLIENSWATEKELKELEKKIRQEIEADVAKLLNDPEPTFHDMYNNVTISRPYIRGVTMDLTQHDYETSWSRNIVAMALSKISKIFSDDAHI